MMDAKLSALKRMREQNQPAGIQDDAPQMTEEKPSLFQKLKNWMQSTPEQSQPASQEVADALNSKLPDSLSGRQALLSKRRRFKQLDDLAE